MKKSRVFTLGLACFLGAVTAFSALAATLGGGAFLANLGDNSALSSASNTPENLIAEEEKIAAEMQADLLAGTLELDPENDPVLGTTESGIEIKFHGKALSGTWNYTTFMTNYLEPFTGSGTFTNLSGYLYISLGGYDWIIIGRNSNLNSISVTNTYAQGTATPAEFIKFASYNSYASTLNSQTESTTDAGSAIISANTNGIVNTVSSASRTYSYNLSSYGAPVGTTEIPSGCVLCISSSTIGDAVFNSTEKSYYPNGELDTAMTTIYNNIAVAANNKIQSTSLTTYGSNSTAGNSLVRIYTHTDYLFPFATSEANSSQNFCVETYLTTKNMRVCTGSSYWWLRSGVSSAKERAWAVYQGNVSDGTAFKVKYENGVRPAFVLKIT